MCMYRRNVASSKIPLKHEEDVIYPSSKPHHDELSSGAGKNLPLSYVLRCQGLCAIADSILS